MRVSSKSIQMQWLAVLAQQQSDVARLQQQVSSGRRINSAADDPVGAAQMTLFQQGIDRIQTYSANADTAERRLSLEESSLNQVTDVLQRARELVVQAGGASALTDEARQSIANEIKELRASLVDIANTQDGEGRYLFAGNAVQTRPFAVSGNAVNYLGDQGVRMQRISDDRLIQENDSGDDVFNAIRNGNGVFSVSNSAANTGNINFAAATVTDPAAWVVSDHVIAFTSATDYVVVEAGVTIASGSGYVPGSSIEFNGVSIDFEGEPATGDLFFARASRNQSVFATLDNLVGTLESSINNPSDRAQFQTGLNNSLMDLEQSLTHINDVRSDVGARLKAIDSQRGVNDEVAYQLETSLSKVRDLDYASAIADLQLRLLSLETAQKSYAQTQRTSLFDFI